MKQIGITLRKVFVLCLMAMVAQIGFAGSWDGTNHKMTYVFTAYPTTFNLTQGSEICETISNIDLYTMEDSYTPEGGSLTFFHQLDAIFAAQRVGDWRIKSGEGLYQGGNGYRYLSISNLFAGATVYIDYIVPTDASKPVADRSIRVVNSSDITESLTDNVLSPQGTYTMAQDGPLELSVARWITIKSIVIDYSGATGHPMFFNRADSRIEYYKDNIPYYRCQLSTRNFTEPTVSGVTSYDYSTVESSNGYDPAVLKTESGVKVHDVLMNNIGVSQINLSDGTHTDSYRIDIWDNPATTLISDITKGKKFQITGSGVLQNRTITDVPGIEMKFSVTNEGVEPNTTIAMHEKISGTDDHYVSYTNDNNGWWDRFPQDNYSWPSAGTYYSFKATAKGKLRFGGIKKTPSVGASGKVYLVKLATIEEDGKTKSIYPQAYLFTGDQSGYLTTDDFTSITYSTHENDANQEISDAPSYSIIANEGANNGINLNTGEVYYLQGEANSSDNKWAPYLLEWFSFELDDELRIDRTFAVANQKGSELPNSEDDGNYYIASNVNVTGSPQVGCFENGTWVNSSTLVKGNISSAKARLNSSTHHLEFYNIEFDSSEDNMKGGAIKVRLRTSETNYVDFTLTIPYGKHVWDFRSTEDQSNAKRPGAWHYSDTELCTMMKDNSAANWKIAWKVRKNDGSQYEDPIMVPDGAINGDNAFCMDNTAGLVFVAGPRSFGAKDTRDISGLTSAQKGKLTAIPTAEDLASNDGTVNKTPTSATNLLWLKGNATIYFPGVTAGQYIKIYTYRHADDKGETFWAKNLVDLDGNAYLSSNRFIMHGMWEERRPAFEGDNIKGCAIFRVPSSYVSTDVLDNIPQLTLCDDGWMKIYRIEIMDEFEPDIILTDDNPGGNFCPVDYDGEFGSVVVRKRHGKNEPTLRSYLGVVGQTQCMHANTCDYQIIADEYVVDVNKEVWTSGGGVNYNKLNLRFNKAGLVRIVQRERASLVGSSNNWAETKNEDGDPIYVSTHVASMLMPNGYVVDKNEYYINVGELTVQDYPYTWDFTNYNMYKGSSATKSTLTSRGWIVSDNTCSQTALVSDVNFGSDQIINNYGSSYVVPQTPQVRTSSRAMFPQGAQLMNNEGTVVAETEGLGVSRPKTSTSKSFYVFDSSTGSFDRNVRNYDGFALEDNKITINGDDLTGVGEITIPEVDNQMYIFVKSNSEPLSVNGATLVGTDPFSKKEGIYLYQNNSGSTQDVVLSFSESTKVNLVAVTDIVKRLDKFGYATESRDRAIDHTYEGELTSNEVHPYIIETVDGGTYNYRGYPMVSKTLVEDNIVPANMGVVLCKDNHSGDPFDSPLFVPAVNNVPAYDAADGDFWKRNWLIPNVQRKRHYNENTSGSAAAETSINVLPYYDNGVVSTPTWNIKKAESTIYGSYSSDPVRYVDLSGYKELRIYQTEGAPVRCFFFNSNNESVTITTGSSPVELVSDGSYYKVDLKSVYDNYGQVKLIGIKAAGPEQTATVDNIHAVSYVNPSLPWSTKFVMGPSYYTYYKRTGTSSDLQDAETESFYRMRLYDEPNASEADKELYNTLGANKALLLISSLPDPLWKKGGASGARQGVIYFDMPELEEDATNIEMPITLVTPDEVESHVYYTLAGNRVKGKPTKKGIYICNGKIVTVK